MMRYSVAWRGYEMLVSKKPGLEQDYLPIRRLGGLNSPSYDSTGAFGKASSHELRQLSERTSPSNNA